jgi:hypothetical protein
MSKNKIEENECDHACLHDVEKARKILEHTGEMLVTVSRRDDLLLWQVVIEQAMPALSDALESLEDVVG